MGVQAGRGAVARRMRNFSFIMGMAFLLPSCVLAPGMKLDENQLAREGVEETLDNASVGLVPINAQSIVKLNQALGVSPSPVVKGEKDEPYIYLVGPQDVLQVTVWDHPELTIPAGQYRTAADSGNVVNEDGTIFYPYIGKVQVAGQTVDQIRELLAEKLKPYIKDPQVDVRVAAFRSKKVYVTGEVAKPGVIPVTDIPLTLLDAINEAGGIKPNLATNNFEADLANVTLIRQGRMTRINLLAMLNEGDISKNIRLQDGDVINVPDNSQNKVFVLGEVSKQMAVPIHQGRMSLLEAIGEAGGFVLSSANPGKVYVIRGIADEGAAQTVEVGRARVFKLDAGSPDALVLADQFKLQPRDVVYVSTAEVVRWGRVLGQLTSTVQAIALGRAISR